MVRTAVAVCVWAAAAGVTVTALMLAHLVGRGEQLETRVLTLVRSS